MSKSPIGEPLQRDLENALKTEEFKKAFEELKAGKDVFGKYPTVEALCALADPGHTDYERKDAVFAAILAGIRKDKALYPLIHRMLWDSLDRLFLLAMKSDADPEEVFAKIHAEFYLLVTAYPEERCSRKIDVNLILGTRKKISRWQGREGKRRAQCGWLPQERIGGLPISALRESAVFPEEMVEYLLDLVYRKVITEQQYDLLLETKVYRRMDLREWAKSRGLGYALSEVEHSR